MKKLTPYHLFLGPAKIVENMTPQLEGQLKQADIDQSPLEYLSKSFLIAFILFCLVFFSITFILQSYQNENSLLIGVLLGISVVFFSLLYAINYPLIIIKRRVREIELNLFYALQSMLIQISSGETIFNAMVNLSSGNRYGALSTEFKKTVEDVRAGRPIINALEEMVLRNPSKYLNETLWHIINTIKIGSNLKENLEDIVDSLSREQANVVRIFGSQLSLLSMAYMMIAVIIPSLGVTVLLIISSLGSIEMGLEEIHFWMLLLLTLGIQLLFMTVIKSKRPAILGF